MKRTYARMVRKPARRRGLTLLECTIALIIVPMAVSAVAIAVSTGQQQSLDAMQRVRAAMLAEALMEQVIAKDYASIQSFCTSFSESPNAVKDATATLYPQPMQAYQRTIACSAQSVTLNFVGGGTSVRSGLQVTVTVKLKTRTLATLTRFFAQP